MASGSGWNLWVWLAGGECLVGVVVINPRRACLEGYGSCPVCVSVCLCVSVCVCVSVRNLNLGTGASRGLNEGTSE